MLIQFHIFFYNNNKLMKNKKTTHDALDIRIYKESLRILHS